MELGDNNACMGPRIHWALTLAVLYLCSGLTHGQESESEASAHAVEVSVEAKSSQLTPVGSGYHDLEATRELLGHWVQSGGENVQWVESFGNVPAIEFGAGDLQRDPLDRRRTVVLAGGLDGLSVAGGEAVLRAGYRLLEGLHTLRPDLAFLLVPWASPEGLARVDLGQSVGGRDLDGDGLVLQMLVEDPDGPWTPSMDPRFLSTAKPGDAPRFRRLTEGAQSDDETWDFDLNRCFPLLSGLDASGGAPSIEEREERVACALREFVLARPCALVVSFQGNHGGIAYPGASPSPPWEVLPDQALYEKLGRAFRRTTGRSRAPVLSIFEARGGQEKGSFVDWCYTVPGVLAMEVAPWGVGLTDVDPAEEQGLIGVDAWDFRPALDEKSRRWATWLDDARGGLGFSEWRPVVTPEGNSCLVGGWQPRTYWNPPADELARSLQTLDAFIFGLVQRLPYLELCDVSVEREGELCTVLARLRCVGSMPLQPQVFGRWSGTGDAGRAWLRVQTPNTVQRIAGPDNQLFSRLESGGRSAEISWLLYAPEGTRLYLEFGLGETNLGGQELVL
ncbi:MAG: hypothetical protein ACI87O_001639 [Planctomycetota bacterium]|jgi:hypothetical protein